MKQYLYAIWAIAVLASCVNSYNIEGSSNVSSLDSKKLYLRAVRNNEMKDIDSTEMVHGQFHFTGTTDSVRFATLFIDNGVAFPLVLEGGDIQVKFNLGQTQLSGTPLNDKLYTYLKSSDSLQLQLNELQHRFDRAIMDGEDMSRVVRELQNDELRLNMSLDTLVTSFITENFDNVLGPGIFMLVTATYPYPEMRPWIVQIMSKATENFKNDPYVKMYVSEAQHFQNVQNGLEQMPAPQQPQASAPAPQGPAPKAPTPNEMAAPAPEAAAPAPPAAPAPAPQADSPAKE